MFWTAIFLMVMSTASTMGARQIGYCSMYGTMPKYEQYPLPYNGPAKSVDSGSYTILQDFCPRLTTKKLGETKSCCDLTQLEKIRKFLSTMRTLFAKCPSCFRNLANLFCDFFCSPDQSTFVSYAYNPRKPYIPAVAKYYIAKRLSEGLYKSCKDVYFPGHKRRVIDVMCGVSRAECTGEKFLNFLGQPYNSLFSIDFVIDKHVENFTNNDFKMTACNEQYDGHTPACSCKHCPLSCVLPNNGNYVTL